MFNALWKKLVRFVDWLNTIRKKRIVLTGTGRKFALTHPSGNYRACVSMAVLLDLKLDPGSC